MDKLVYADLSEEEEKHLRSLFKEDPEQIRKDLEYLREWLKKQPHLPHDMDDTMLLHFLRCRKYSLEDTKEKIDAFYTCKGMVPEICENMDPLSPDMKLSVNNMVACAIPGYTPEGYRVLLYSLQNVDPKIYDYDMIAKRSVCSYLIMLASDTLQRGVVVIIDISAMKAAHAVKISMAQIRKSLVVIQEGYPQQMKKVFVLGLSSISARFANIFLQFVKEKSRKRVVFLEENKMEDIYKVIPKKMLPNEYGGSAGPSFDINERWYKELISRREFLTEMEKKISDESRRPGKPKNASDILGIEGSFRQLAVD